METWKMIEPVPGDHIRVLVKGYYHHGIYIGNDEVATYTGTVNRLYYEFIKDAYNSLLYSSKRS